MRRLVPGLLLAGLCSICLAADDAVTLSQRAAERMSKGDKEGACADAKAALALDPANDAAHAAAALACRGAALPNKAQYTPKLKPKKFESAPNAPETGIPPAGAGAPEAQASQAPAQAQPAAGGGPAAEPKWYEGGPKLEAGVVVPEKAAQLDPKLESSAQLTSAAGSKLETGDYREAIRLATEAIESNPANPRALLVRGVALKAKKQCKAAAADAEEGLNLRPNDLLLLKLKAESLNCARDYKAALLAAEEVLTINPTDARAHATRAWALKGMGDEAGMLDELKKAAAFDNSYEYTLASVEKMKDDPDVFFLYPGERPPQKKGAAKESQGLSRTSRLAISGGFALLTFIGIMMGISQWARSRSARRAAPPVEEESQPAFAPQPSVAAAPSPAPEPAGPEPEPEPGRTPVRLGPQAFKEPEKTPSTPAAELPEVERLAAGTVIASRYDIEDLLGSGMTGSVYSGFDKKLSRIVAVRRLRPELAGDEGERSKLLEASGKLGLPSHPGIVGLFDALKIESEAYLVMDYVDGKPLAKMMGPDRRMMLVDCVAVALQACQALDAAHRAGVAHGDLKPGNIMVDKRGGVRILDFRISRLAKDALARLGSQEPAKSRSYLAPEQYRGPAVPASDLYSLGLCFYEMLTGVQPFKTGALAEKTGGALAPCSTLRPDLPKAVDTVLEEVLRVRPDERLSDPLEFLKRLQSLG
ncbi:MAG: protein kinase [Elusimicrobia bacterium]|nr:protein kinase [Elusimicrobiota bacterium]